MKKILEKIVSIALTIVGLLFIALLLVLMFGAIGVEELDNQLVKALMIALSCVFAVLAFIMVASSFADHDKLSSILLFKDKESATKATVSVVKKLVKKASKRVETAKVTKVAMFADDNNNVKLIVYIKVKSNETEAVIDRVRAEILATCDKVLVYQFTSIDFKIIQVKADYKPTDTEIEAKVAEYHKDKEAARLKAAAEKAAQEAKAPVAIVQEETVITEAEVTAAATDETEVAPPESEGVDTEITVSETEEVNSDEIIEASDIDVAIAAPDTEALINTEDVQAEEAIELSEKTEKTDAEDISEAELSEGSDEEKQD